MRKNKFFIAGLVTVFVALVSLTLVSSTWAKYTSSTSGEDSARVAYWGFGLDSSLDLDDLFVEVYEDGNQTVKSTVDVIAPGTKGEATFKFAYTEGAATEPEVAYNFEVSAAGSEAGTNIKANTSIVWSLDGVECANFDELLEKIEALDGSNTGAKRYEAGTLPTGFGAGETHTISWKWNYTGDDAKDTALGNATTLEEVTIIITVTATQID